MQRSTGPASSHRQQISALEADIKEYSGSLAASAEALIKAEQEIEGLTIADIEALRGQLKEVEASKQALTEEKEKLHARIVLNRTQLSSIEKSRAELDAVEEEYRVTGKLAKIARGDNAEKITFERFVLAAFFDDIIQAANMRLTRMTGSRYEMCRKTDRSKGNAQSGLEIEVLDNYTGRTRHIKTLSGGESFKASLSLALGLADVVQSYAGGISLDTMFVDEGFGTLDPGIPGRRSTVPGGAAEHGKARGHNIPRAGAQGEDRRPPGDHPGQGRQQRGVVYPRGC